MPMTSLKAAEQFKAMLASYTGVYDVIDSAEVGKPEIHLTLKAQCRTLRFTP